MMKTSPAGCLVLILVFLAAAGVAAAQDDVIRVNTRLVQVDVVVRDKNGPVTNLTQDDFTVLDNGKPQRIDVFSIWKSEPSAAPEDSVPLAPGVLSNRRDTQSDAPTSATVILFDLLNTDQIYQNFATQQLLAYLRTIRTDDRTAIYVLDNELHVLQDFTQDPEMLISAVAGMDLGSVPGADARTVRQLARSMAVGGGRGPGRLALALAGFYRKQRVDPTADAIQSIARHLGGLPGRKNLIWMSANIPLSAALANSANSRETDIDRAVRQLNEANIAIYPVDIRGLLAPEVATTAGRRGQRLEPYPPPDAMIRLAEATGGRAFYFNNDLEGAVRKAVSDAEVSYTVGFYPLEGGFDGKFHRLAVKVARDDLEIRHRSGYFAPRDQAPTDDERAAVMSDLLSSPLDASEVGLEAHAESDPAQAGLYHVTITVDAADLHLEHRDDRWIGTLDVARHLESSDEKSVGLGVVLIDLTDELFRTALRRGLVMKEVVSTDRPEDRFRIVVQDRATGLAGSLSVPLN